MRCRCWPITVAFAFASLLETPSLCIAASADSDFERRVAGRDDLTALSVANGFCRGQERTVSRLASSNLQVAPALNLALFRFHEATGDGCNGVEKALKNFIKSRASSKAEADRLWEELLTTLDSELEKISGTEEYKSAVVAEQFVQELSNRTAGKMDKKILGTLLSASPEIRKAPALEFIRGFTRQYRSEGHKKSGAVSVQLKLPLSWQEKEGDAPHVPDKWAASIGVNDGVLVVSLIIFPMSPSKLRESELALKSGEFADLLDSIEEGLPGGYIEASRKIQLMMRPALEADFSMQTLALDKEMRFRGLYFMGLATNGVVSINCSVGGAVESRRVNAWFDRYRDVCRLVASSLFDVRALSSK